MIFTTVLQAQGGSWAEYAISKPASLIPLPNNLTFAQGAAIPIAGKTVLECMRELDLKEDDKLFIAGASGAIGTLAIQLAANKGVHVSASASEKNHNYMEDLGVQKAVDYNDPDWINKVKIWSNGGVNSALAIQPATGADSIKVVKDDGKLITVSGYYDAITPERGIVAKQMDHHDDTQNKVVELVNDISDGKIKLVIEKEYSFEHALDALIKTETRHARGKLVVSL